METDGSGSLQQDGAEALRLMEEAIALLDRCDAPGEIGAQLDHAIQRLRDVLSMQHITEETMDRPPRHP
jgi:hypothetical protein